MILFAIIDIVGNIPLIVLLREKYKVIESDDYINTIIGNEEIDGYDCWKIELIPNEDAPSYSSNTSSIITITNRFPCIKVCIH